MQGRYNVRGDRAGGLLAPRRRRQEGHKGRGPRREGRTDHRQAPYCHADAGPAVSFGADARTSLHVARYMQGRYDLRSNRAGGLLASRRRRQEGHEGRGPRRESRADHLQAPPRDANAGAPAVSGADACTSLRAPRYSADFGATHDRQRSSRRQRAMQGWHVFDVQNTPRHMLAPWRGVDMDGFGQVDALRATWIREWRS